jgi:hypothetical protein
MTIRKKQPTTKVDLGLPIPMISFYEGVAAYAGVSLEDVLKVLLAMGMLKGRAVGKERQP